MKIMKFFFSLVLLFALLCACSEQSFFPVHVHISGQPLRIADSLNQVTRVYLLDSKLLIRDYDGKNFLLSYDLDTKAFSRFVEKGDAPNQVMSVQSIGVYQGLLYVFDTGNQCFKLFNAEDGTYVRATKRLSQYVNLFARPLDDNLLVGCPYSDSVRIAMYDSVGNVVSKNYQYPFRNSFSPSYAHMFSTMSDLTIHPTEKKIAMTTQYASDLQIFEYDNENLRLVVEKEMEAPEYSIKENSFAVNSKTKWGYLSIASDEEFIYLLYSGAIQQQVQNPCIGNRIHVFDWNGNAVAEIEVSEMLTSICVSNKKMYAIQSGTTFEYEILEYDLTALN